MADVGWQASDAAGSRGSGEWAGFGSLPKGPGLLVRLIEAEQDRWFLWVPVVFGGGIWLYFALAEEPAILVAGAALSAAIGLSWLWRTGLAALIVPGLLVCVAGGFAAGKLRTEIMRQPVLETRLDKVRISGVVDHVEPRVGDAYRIVLRVQSIAGVARERTPHRIRVHVKGSGSGLRPGVAVSLIASLAPPPRPAFPGGFDFARSAYFLGLGAVGFARNSVDVQDGGGDPGLWGRVRHWLGDVRQGIGQRVTHSLGGQSGAIANALITGERGMISEQTNAAYRDSGLTHVLSISGLHMTIMAGFVFGLVRLLFSAVPSIVLRFETKKWAAALAVVAALGYLLISGGSYATVRSWIMITIMFLAVLVDRPAVALRNVALAALAILAVFPESLFDVGFQMSFAAVAGLVSIYEALSQRRREAGHEPGGRAGWRVLAFLGGIMLATIVAGVAVAPFGIYHFHKSQQFAVVANLIAIPICNMVVMPMALVTLLALPFGLEFWPLWVMGQGIQWMTGCAEWVAGLPLAVVPVPAIPTAAFALMVGGGLWFLLWRGGWRFGGLVAIAAGVALAPQHRFPDVLVGRGGELVAMRGSDGVLWAAGGRGSLYELERWLEHDGDGRKARVVLGESGGRCDRFGCVGDVKGRRVAVVRHPSALRDACGQAAIIVVAFDGVPNCRASNLVLVRNVVERLGTHAIYLNDDAISVDTVASWRGKRPWSGGVQ